MSLKGRAGLLVGSCSERRGRRPTAGRGRVGGGRPRACQEGPGLPGGLGGQAPGEGGGEPGPVVEPPRRGGRAQEAAAGCLRGCGIRSVSDSGYLWAGEKVALPLRRPPRLRSRAGRQQLAAGRPPARGLGVRPGACGSPALEGVETRGR